MTTIPDEARERADECPCCYSRNINVVADYGLDHRLCRDCGRKWKPRKRRKSFAVTAAGLTP